MSSASDHDRISMSIEIAASAERVWGFIEEPGWFINDGRLTAHEVERVAADTVIIHDPVHGPFAFRTVTLDPPRYASFRWLESARDLDAASTLIEFTVEELGPGTVRLTVVESGLASMPGTEKDRRRRYEENLQGWHEELALAREALQQPVTSRHVRR